MDNSKLSSGNQIPEELGTYMAYPKVLDKQDFDAITKVIVIHLIDRFRLSLTNDRFKDEYGIYILYPNQALMADVPCCEKTLRKAKRKLEAPETAEERTMLAALEAMSAATEPVTANGHVYSAEAQRLAAEWAQAEDVAEVLHVLAGRSAEKTVPYVRAVLLAYMDETYGADMRLYQDIRTKKASSNSATQ